jgi:CubicO group peptidase (beta-lactamase class C family)
MIERKREIFAAILLGVLFICLSITGMSCSTGDSTDGPADELKSESGIPEIIEVQLDQLFEYCQENSMFSGSVLIAFHGKVVFKKSFGMADWDNRTPNTPATNFNVASTTKPFTALAIAILEEDGRVEYDAPVTQYLRELPYESVTIRHLLTHTSGLPDYPHQPPFIKFHDATSTATPQENPFTSQDILDWLIKNKADLVFEPGSGMSYCNAGYVLLSLVIEQVSGQNYAEYIREHILVPAGMNNSMIYRNESDPQVPNRAYGFSPTLDRTGFVRNDLHSMDGILGDGGLYSSVEDLFRFDQILYSHRLVSEETSSEIFSPCILNDGQKKGYGFGWIIAGYDSSEPLLVKHGGKWRGFTTAFQRMIEDASTIIILTNCGLEGPTIGGIRDAAADILLHQELKFPRFPIADTIAEVLFREGAETAVHLFHQLRKESSERYFVDEHQLNVLGYRLMYENRLEDARRILEANAEAYPESSNVYDSLGDVYKAAGDTLKAIEKYKKALAIDPGQNYTIKKLEDLSDSG